MNPDNYDDMDLPSSSFQTFTACLGPAKKKGVKKIRWTDKPPVPQGRQQQCDILKEAPVLKSAAAKAVESMRDAFNLFVTPGMMKVLV